MVQTVFFFLSRYGNQMYVDYNIQCPDGMLAFLNMSDISIEEPNCADPNRNNELT